MADNHRSSQHDSGNLLAHLADKLPCPGTIHIPVHVVEYFIGNMLERNIHIPAHLGIVCHLVKHILRE